MKGVRYYGSNREYSTIDAKSSWSWLINLALLGLLAVYYYLYTQVEKPFKEPVQVLSLQEQQELEDLALIEKAIITTPHAFDLPLDGKLHRTDFLGNKQKPETSKEVQHRHKKFQKMLNKLIKE